MSDSNTPDIHALVSQCTTGDSRAKIHALIALQEADARHAAPSIVPLLTDIDEDVRGTAARVLGRLGSDHVEQIGPLLQALLSDADDSTRNRAAESLGLLRYTPARSELEHVLLHDDYWVARASAADALGRLGDRAALTALEAALDDEMGPVRSYAAYSIGELGVDSQLPAIRRRLAVEVEIGPRAELAAAALRLGDPGAFDELLALIPQDDSEAVYDVLRVIEDLISERAPAALIARAAELARAVSSVAPHAGIYQDYASQLQAQLADLAQAAGKR